VDYKTAVKDPALIAQVKDCTGVYFIGGDQARITQAGQRSHQVVAKGSERLPCIPFNV
jgi:cyanophycinase-like exopeptidase